MTRSIPPTMAQVRNELLLATRRDVQRMAGILFVLQWVGAIAFAATTVARSWDSHGPILHPHLYAAVVLGAVATLLPTMLARLHADSRATTIATAVGQMTFAILLTVVSGGRIAFASTALASLAFLAFFRDETVIVVAGAIALSAELAMHVAQGQSLAVGSTDAVTILLTTVALVWGGIQARRAVTAIAEARVNVETARVDVELTRAVLDQRDADAREQAVRARVDQAEQHEREASLKTRTQLLASLSHELRTPLNAVVGFLDLLARSSLTTPQSSHVEGARTSAKHVLALISDVLDASKIESGALELERAAFDVANTVREAARLVESSARDRNVTLEVDVADDLTAPLVGDSLRLRQIVLNLLSNAIKFTRTRVVLRARWSGETDSLSIEVEDDGVGIPEDRVARIFEPYRQADRSTSRRHGGTGLGLSISRQLARLMRGDLVVESRHGSGSTFRFSAPLPRADAADLAVGASEEMAVEVPPLRVLLADDDASNRLVGGQLLGVLGHTVDLAIDGTDALEQALAVQHDLIILDVEMPHLDGTEVARRLRTAGVNVPILGFTGHASSQQRVACLRAGMDGVVEKPADLSRLSKGILDVLLPPGGPHRRENGAEVAKSLASHVGVPTPPIGVSRPEVAEALAARLAANTAPHPKPSAPLRDVGSGLDLDELDQRVGGDAQLFRDVLVAVRDESRRLFCELGQATERRDLEGMRKVAHTLKGCVANVGARPVREAVTAVEVAAKAGEVERALELAGHAITLGDSLAAALAHACEQRAA